MMKVKVKVQQEKEKEPINLSSEDGIIPITQPTELGDSLKELNKDNIDTVSRTSDIDLRARLHYMEVSSILALDSLVAFGVCPTRCLAFTRQKKRLSVSLDGKGRGEIVSVVAGKREHERSLTGMDKIRGWFSGNKQEG